MSELWLTTNSNAEVILVRLQDVRLMFTVRMCMCSRTSTHARSLSDNVLRFFSESDKG